MDKQTIDWLLEGPAWIRYAVESQLLDLKPDINSVLNDETIVRIVKRLKNPNRGIPAIKHGHFNSDNYENPYWDLFFLADLGLKAADLNLTSEIDDFLDTQSPKGAYITESGMEESYCCKSAIIISAIARMGYQNNHHIQKYLRMLLSSQRLDGGWYCNPNHDIGAPLQYEPSCPQENMNVLLLMAQYPENLEDPRFNGAIDLLLHHWEVRNTGAQIVYFGVGRHYQKLCYPATRYGILRVIDSVSLFPYSRNKTSFQSMLDFIHRKAVNGRYSAEVSTPYTDLESPGEPSRLLTFIVNRVEKRMGSPAINL